MTAHASSAAVESAQQALGCYPDECSSYPDCGCHESALNECMEHDEAWTERGCPVAVAVADAAIQADAPRLRAEALEDAAKSWQSGEGFVVMALRGVGLPAIDYAQRALEWLRARAAKERGQ